MSEQAKHDGLCLCTACAKSRGAGTLADLLRQRDALLKVARDIYADIQNSRESLDVWPGGHPNVLALEAAISECEKGGGE